MKPAIFLPELALSKSLEHAQEDLLGQVSSRLEIPRPSDRHDEHPPLKSLHQIVFGTAITVPYSLGEGAATGRFGHLTILQLCPEFFPKFISRSRKAVTFCPPQVLRRRTEAF